MHKTFKKILPLTILSILCLTACSSTNKQESTASNHNTVNQTTDTKEAFDFLAYDKDGKTVKLSDFKGKKVYINVWASWCGPCIKEIPELEKVYQKLKDKDDIVFLSMTSPSDSEFKNTQPLDKTKDIILAKAKELDLSYPVLFDANDKFMINYNIRSFPTHIFINADGTINNQIVGMMSEEKLEEHINAIQ